MQHVSEFDEEWYIARYQDVANALANREITSALEHFQKFGLKEGRKPTPMTVQDQVPEFVSENEKDITLELSERVVALLNELRIFADKHRRILRISKVARLEPYIYWANPVALNTMGAFSYSMTHESSLSVGRYCSIADGVSTLGERHPMEHVTSSSVTYDPSKPHFRQMMSDFLDGYESRRKYNRVSTSAGSPVLQHDVWIGQHALLSRGITIQTGAVVAAGSVVTKDVPPYTVVAGVPAKPIRRRFSDNIMERLLESVWWDYSPKTLFDFEHEYPERFLDRFEEAKYGGRLSKMVHPVVTWKTIIARLAR